MKNRKIELSELRVNSFVTEQSANIKGGAKYTAAGSCYVNQPVYSEKCQATWDCVKSMDYICEYNK